MSNGIVVNGDGNSLVFSTDSDNLFFQGKATYTANYSQRPIDYEDFQGFWGVLYNVPCCVFYEYIIDLPSSVNSILPFIYNPVGKRVSIVSLIKTSSVRWTIMIIATTNPNVSAPENSPTEYIPTVYVFSDHIDAAVNTGYGINVFNSSGTPTFTTNEKPLLIKSLYTGNVPYSNLSIIDDDRGSLRYYGNSPNRFVKSITWFSPLGTPTSITKPAIYYSCNQTCVGVLSPEKYIYESAAAFNPANSQLGIEWALVGYTFFGSLSPSQSTTSEFSAFIIDASQYD